MSNQLVVNPFLRLETHLSEQCYLIAPKPGEGLCSLEISKSAHPELNEIFTELVETQFEFLDVEKDLSENQRNLLFEHGVLVDKNKIPDQPLFSCDLATIKAEKFIGDHTELIVNPTFRFEPFSFENLSTWSRERHLSPHKPSIWVSSLQTGIEIGYWLEQEQAEFAANFQAGEKPRFTIETNFLSKLVGCGVLISPGDLNKEEVASTEMIGKAKLEFQQKKYTVFENILPAEQMKAMREFYRQHVSEGFMPFGDTQSRLRYREHNEPLARYFHNNFRKLMTLLVGEEVVPSYVYAASYKEGATLEPHTDRAQCEYSISFQVDYQPEPEGQISPWALHLTRPELPIDDNKMYGWEDYPETLANGEKRSGIHLASGDGLVYRGRELIHYRYELPAGHSSTSLFFHYVAKGFEGDFN